MPMLLASHAATDTTVDPYYQLENQQAELGNDVSPRMTPGRWVRCPATRTAAPSPKQRGRQAGKESFNDSRVNVNTLQVGALRRGLHACENLDVMGRSTALKPTTFETRKKKIGIN